MTDNEVIDLMLAAGYRLSTRSDGEIVLSCGENDHLVADNISDLGSFVHRLLIEKGIQWRRREFETAAMLDRRRAAAMP